MARPSTYDFSFLKKYKGKSVIYALYTDDQGVKYIGHSKNVYERVLNHLRNHISESNKKKYNWIEKYKNEVRVSILSDNHDDWEAEETHQINKHKYNDLLNVCLGGKDNRKQKPFHLQTTEDHLLAINKSLSELNSYYKKKGKKKVFTLFTKKEIQDISNGIYSGTNTRKIQ